MKKIMRFSMQYAAQLVEAAKETSCHGKSALI